MFINMIPLQTVSERKFAQSLAEKEIDHKHHIEDHKLDNTWTSCCLKVDKNAVTYFTSMCILGGLIIGSGTCLILYPANALIYSNILTLSIGAILPSPTYLKSSNDDKKN